MSRLSDAIAAGKHIKLVNMVRWSTMSNQQIQRELGLMKLNSQQISLLFKAGIEHGMKEREAKIKIKHQEDKPTFQASFHDLILDDGSITVGDIYPQMKKTKFKSKYSNI